MTSQCNKSAAWHIPAAHGPAIVPGLPQRHGNGGRGRQPAPPQGASDKTSGSISIPMPSSASPGISPEPPAVRGLLPGDDETARLPSPESVLSPLVASKPHRCGTLPNLPVHRRGLLEGGEPHARYPSPRRVPGNPLCGLSSRSAALY